MNITLCGLYIRLSIVSYHKDPNLHLCDRALSILHIALYFLLFFVQKLTRVQCFDLNWWWTCYPFWANFCLNLKPKDLEKLWIIFQSFFKQESIPVGCIPLACWPWGEGGVYPEGVCLGVQGVHVYTSLYMCVSWGCVQEGLPLGPGGGHTHTHTWPQMVYFYCRTQIQIRIPNSMAT